MVKSGPACENVDCRKFEAGPVRTTPTEATSRFISPEKPSEVDRQNLNLTLNPLAGRDEGRGTEIVRQVLSPTRKAAGVAWTTCGAEGPEIAQPETGMTAELPVAGRTILSLKLPLRVGSRSAAMNRSWADRFPASTVYDALYST
jgi:hypothetical protein